MHYYGVLPASQRFHGDGTLTYSSESELKIGSLVMIELRSQPVLGLVATKETKPSFKVKPILEGLDITPLPDPSLELLKWMIDYYPAPLGTIISQFIPNGLKARNIEQGSKPEPTRAELPPLGDDQKRALEHIARSNQSSFVLHGDTGTGKTRVYIELAKKVLASNHSALILTPEIGLTPQLVRDFRQVFGGQVLVVHSNLTPKQRQETWLSVLNSKQPLIVVGPRSSLFSPFKTLGLIVIDEAHDSAYKQEQAPYYQTMRVAGRLAKIHGATFIIGSATPNVADYYIAETKQVPVLRLKQLVVKTSAVKPKFHIIDRRDRDQFKRSQIISEEILRATELTLKKDQQSLIFLNRRGTARAIMCQNCGWQALCPNCDLPLIYHGDSHDMRCHTCGHDAKTPPKCPVCSSLDIIYKTAGTKAVAEDLSKLFPKARIQRFDTDNKKSERFEQHFETISDVDIIVGTQIITKGLDLPKLGLVGVLAADSSLSFPDYTAQERTFQQLTQILGRIGRGHTGGQAIIQTFQPDSPILQAAINKDWHGFYQSELEERRRFMFPPFCYLLKLTARRKTITAARSAAMKLIEELSKSGLKIKIIGPSPSFYEKTKQGYAWQIVIKAKDRSQLIKVIKSVPSCWSYDLDPASLL